MFMISDAKVCLSSITFNPKTTSGSTCVESLIAQSCPILFCLRNLVCLRPEINRDKSDAWPFRCAGSVQILKALLLPREGSKKRSPSLVPCRVCRPLGERLAFPAAVRRANSPAGSSTLGFPDVAAPALDRTVALPSTLCRRRGNGGPVRRLPITTLELHF